jgi:hypothetical protein
MSNVFFRKNPGQAVQMGTVSGFMNQFRCKQFKGALWLSFKTLATSFFTSTAVGLFLCSFLFLIPAVRLAVPNQAPADTTPGTIQVGALASNVPVCAGRFSPVRPVPFAIPQWDLRGDTCNHELAKAILEHGRMLRWYLQSYLQRSVGDVMVEVPELAFRLGDVPKPLRRRSYG